MEVVIANKSRDMDYSVSVILRVDTVTYNGKLNEPVCKEKFDILVRRKSGNLQDAILPNIRFRGKCAFHIPQLV